MIYLADKPIEFKYYPGIKSIISSHVANEAQGFVPSYVKENTGFDQLLHNFIPGDAPTQVSQRACVTARYCPNDKCNQLLGSRYMIQDSMFVCNVRFIFDATQNQSPKTPIWLMDYAFYGDRARHATDLVPTFWNYNVNITAFEDMMCGHLQLGEDACKELIKLGYFDNLRLMRLRYQKYLVAAAIYGDPEKSGNTRPWPPPVPGPSLSKVLKVQGVPEDFFVLETDQLTTAPTCGFWNCIAQALANNQPPTNCVCKPSTSQLLVQEKNLDLRR